MKIAINGLGRIGRAAFKVALKRPNLEIVAINDLGDLKNLVYLLKYDSVYGRWEEGEKLFIKDDKLYFQEREIRVLSEKEPQCLPWREWGVELVLECTGVFTEYEAARQHLEAGAKKVIISAPSKSEKVATYVLGVNTKENIEEDVISNASCTTNCAAPIMEILERRFGVEEALMTTIHAYTATQNLVDGPAHKDLRRGRAAAINMIPTSTGAAQAVVKTLPSIDNLFDGLAVRVPVAVVSLADITALLKKKVKREELNQTFKEEAESERYRGIVAYVEECLASSDFIGDTHSAIIDGFSTRVIDNLVKIVAWYDNEWGYATRLVDLIERIKI